MTGPPFLDSAAVHRLLPMHAAIDAIEAALRAGLDPEADPPRSIVDVRAGQILAMPSASATYAGIKVVTVAPGNAERDLPRVQGVYVLFDGETLAPLALLDGIALTSLRTPAVSAVAVKHLAPGDAGRLLVFGTGPQAWGHIEAMLCVRPIDRIDVAGRRTEHTTRFVDRCNAAGLPTDAASPDAVVEADIVCCCTTSREPLFDGRLVGNGATVVAVGSHEPDAREVDASLVQRATVVVEARSVARREAGDIVQAPGVPLATLDELVRGTVAVPPDRPRLFKSTGMAWEDLVAASAVYEAFRARS
ncbi:MAG: ornithine cyclodeaminase [Actinobacteria bacterium 13_2_20CM_2_71_6]|nr:MAG: ornithine cyclodeaminase [Actinobacteria bacterium 13_2_20CM_2_71_6]